MAGMAVFMAAFTYILARLHTVFSWKENNV